MTRSLLRLPLAEIAAVLGIFFGVWLIHNTFQPSADTPNFVLLAVGALDILLCFAMLGYMLRGRLREGQALPRSWIVAGAVSIACFLGWMAALFVDSDRLLKGQQVHSEYLKQINKLEDSLHHLTGVLPVPPPAPPLQGGAGGGIDGRVWKTNHDDYARVYDQLKASLRTNAAWDKELSAIDDEVQQMARLFGLLSAPNAIELRLKWLADFAHARERAVVLTEKLHEDIAQTERGLATTHRARWHAVGASALTGVVLLFGCLLFWLLFDRELRRSWKAQARLADDEARFRWLVECQADPIAVLDPAANLLYVNPAWQQAFHYELGELRGDNLLALVHPQDRPRVQGALQASLSQEPIPCRLAGDYGIWHDVELQCQARDDANLLVIRIRDLRETSDVPMLPQPELLTDEKLEAAETRLAELEAECAELRERETTASGELAHQQWLLGSHGQANSDGVLILSARGQVLSWNPAFVRLWKLSDDTMAGHTWQTIAAHMESQVESGWDDFHQTAAQKDLKADNCWEMALEGGRTVEVYSTPLPLGEGAGVRAEVSKHSSLTPNPSPRGRGENAVQFHFRDVTKQKDLETQLRGHHEQSRHWEQQLGDHEEQKKSYEKRLKQLEKQLRERETHCEELESTLREHQDRLHQMNETHESHEADLKASRDAMRRLASGAANDFNNVLSVVLGNTDVLRDNLPKDHVAQNYLDDIHQAASRGTELSQRLLAFSRNHLMDLVPLEMNDQLAALEPKIRVALGHVQLHWQRSEQELWAKSDAHPFEQALLYLVGHARQHMPNGGTLTIATNRVQLSRADLTHRDMKPGSYVQVRLSDTSRGIDDATLPHVFEPYHSVVEGQKGDLSLATAYGIVRQSGGGIDVASAKGKGNEWTILLPETKDRPQALRASA